MHAPWLAAGLAFTLAHAAAAQDSSRPVVVELFTSQGCSSCPPADSLVAELARTRPDLLPLTFHVTYWNSLGWQDPYSFQAATERQRAYVADSVSSEVYTPAMVVNGVQDVVGSDRPAVQAALGRAVAQQQTAASLTVARTGPALTITVGPGQGRAAILLLGFDRQHQTHVGRGENAGRTLVEANVVRSMSLAGRWDGKPIQLTAPVPAGETAAVILQVEDGRIVGAAQLPASAS